ncbi:MAG: Arm DNA-binding domain-containing protein, partial [Caldilineaceae bacterium]
MGRGDGVTTRGDAIRLFFVDQHGARHRETLRVNGKPLAPTAPNLAYAKRLAARIRKEVELGVFSMAEHFPHSKKAAQAEAVTFGTLADQWLASKGHLSDATKSQYRLACGVWKRLLGAATPLERLTHGKLAATIGGHPWASAKLRNNYLIALRGILGLHYRGRLALENPLADIKNARVARKLPDPLTLAERDAILADLAKHYDTRVVSYFTVAFFTGMRPEELIA